MKRLMLLFFVCLFFGGCTRDYMAMTVLEFENSSSVTVELVTDTDNMSVSESESAKISCELKGDVLPSIFHVWTYSNVKKVVFDGKVEVSIYDFSPLWDENNYTQVSEKEQTRHLRYTFTDADYQYALEHGTVLE